MSDKELEDKVAILEKKIAFLEGQIIGLAMVKANQQQTPYYPIQFPYQVTCNAS